jgi:hypothetical protein
MNYSSQNLIHILVFCLLNVPQVVHSIIKFFASPHHLSHTIQLVFVMNELSALLHVLLVRFG